MRKPTVLVVEDNEAQVARHLAGRAKQDEDPRLPGGGARA